MDERVRHSGGRFRIELNHLLHDHRTAIQPQSNFEALRVYPAFAKLVAASKAAEDIE